MADYTPVHVPGNAVTYNAGGTITGGQCVAVGAANSTVVATSAANAGFVGVAGHDAVSGQKVVTHSGPGTIHTSLATGAVARGGLVATATAGTIAAIGAGTFDLAIGVALETGTDVPVRWKSIR